MEVPFGTVTYFTWQTREPEPRFRPGQPPVFPNFRRTRNPLISARGHICKVLPTHCLQPFFDPY